MASSQSNNEKPRGLPNPYAPKVLPNPYALATVAESGPVRFTEEQKAEQKKTHAFHNPHKIQRPQARGANVPKRPVMAKSAVPSSSSSDAAPTQEPSKTTQQPGIDWWRSTVEDDAATLEYKRQLAYEQREKKKQEKKFAKQYGWWKGEAPYRPDKWSNLRAYRASGVYGYKLDSFSQFLQSQSQPPRMRNISSDSSKSESSPQSASSSPQPPTASAKPSFAPPASYGEETLSQNAHPPPPPQSEPLAAAPPPPPPPPQAQNDVPPPPPAPEPYNPTISAPPVRYSPTISAPPMRYENATISAPPVRYETNTEHIDDVEPEERPAKRPKLSKAEAMMAKMGYVKGQGLGKDSDGITTHLEVKARKSANRQVANFNDNDDESRTNVKAQQVFDILGGHSTKRKEPGRFGDESRVVVTWGCVDDIDWSADADRDDGGIRQEMGTLFDSKFGRVERIHVNTGGDGQTPVYIKFASELSALNAVNRFHEGYQFRDRNIRAMYYPEAKFEASMYDH